MESDSIPVIHEAATKGEDCMDDAHSKDLEHLNSSRREFFHSDCKPRSTTSSEHPSKNSPPKLETSSNELANIIEYIQDDPVCTSFEKNFNAEESFSKEISEVNDKVFTENQITSSMQSSNELLISKEADEIRSTCSDETESSEVTNHFVSEEKESTEKFQPPLSEKTDWIQDNLSIVSEENESNLGNQPGLSEETKLACEIQTVFSGEIESNQEIRPVLSVKIELNQEIQPVLSEKIESNQEKIPIVSEENESNQGNQPALSEETKSTSEIQTAFSREMEPDQEIQPVFSEKIELKQEIQTVLSEKIDSNQENISIVSGENESNQGNQPAVSEETKSTCEMHTAFLGDIESDEEIQLILSGKNELNQEIQPFLSGKIKSNHKIQPALYGDIDSTPKIERVYSKEAESTRVIQVNICETNEVIQAPVFKDTASTIVNQLDLSEETKLPEVKNQSVSEKFNENNGTEFEHLKSSCTKASVFSSFSENAQIHLNDTIDPSSASKGFSKITVDSPNPDMDSNSTFPAILDIDSFYKLQNTDEYKNGMHFVTPGGQVLVSPSTPCKPIFENFEIPLLTPNNSPIKSIKNPSPTKDTILTNEVCPNTSLSTLTTMLADWVQKGVKNCSIIFEQKTNVDSIDYSKSELRYGLDLMKQMNNRIETLLKATNGLPDPTSILPQSGCENILIRDNVKYDGVVVRCRLEALQTEATSGYNRIVSFCSDDAKLNNDGLGSNELATKVREIFINLFVKISEDFSKLSMDIERYRGHIRDFCSKMDMLL